MEEGTQADHTLNAVWLVLEVTGGQIGIPLLLITMWFSRLRRLPTLYNLLIIWVVASVISCMLYYAGMHQNPFPPPGLCLAQATMIQAVPIMGSVASFALVYENWSIVSGNKASISPRYRCTLLLIAPWLLFLAASLPAFITGYSYPDMVVYKHLFYCSIHSPTLGNVLAAFTAIALFLTLVYGAKLAILLRRNWREFKRHVSDTSRPESRLHSPYVVLRIAVFAVYILISLIVMLVYVSGKRSAKVQVVYGTIPFALFIIFGTQADIIRVWVNVLVPVRLTPHTLSQWLHAKDKAGPQLLPTARYSGNENSYDVWRKKYLDQNGPYPTPESPLKVHLNGRPAVSYGTVPVGEARQLKMPKTNSPQYPPGLSGPGDE